MKEELGLDHLEGRSWRGLHRHAQMTMVAYAFLQLRRREQTTGEKNSSMRVASANPASGSARHPRRAIISIGLPEMHPLPKTRLETANQISNSAKLVPLTNAGEPPTRVLIDGSAVKAHRSASDGIVGALPSHRPLARTHDQKTRPAGPSPSSSPAGG